MRKILLPYLAIAAIAGIAGCAAQTQTKQDYVVRVSYAYAANDQSANTWRAFMTALDECHNEGYQDAYLAGEPATRCDQSSGDACAHFAAKASYDCVGLGYQAN